MRLIKNPRELINQRPIPGLPSVSVQGNALDKYEFFIIFKPEKYIW